MRIENQCQNLLKADPAQVNKKFPPKSYLLCLFCRRFAFTVLFPRFLGEHAEMKSHREDVKNVS